MFTSEASVDINVSETCEVELIYSRLCAREQSSRPEREETRLEPKEIFDSTLAVLGESSKKML